MMFTQAEVFAMTKELMDEGRSATQWTRRFLVSGGASGVNTESQPPQVVTVGAIAIEASAMRTNVPAWWLEATVRLAVEAQGLPFNPSAQAGNSPSIEFSDTVVWGGITYRVVGVHAFWAPGGDAAARPYLYFVGLAA